MASPQQISSRHRAGSLSQNSARFSPSSSRDPSTARGRALTSASNRDASPRPHTSSGAAPRGAPASEFTFPMERKLSNSSTYGHHRQTSIIHGSVQHSRNTSFVTSPTASPLSNQVVTAESIQRISNGLESVLAEYVSESDTAGESPVKGPSTGSRLHSPSHSAGAGPGSRKLHRVHSASSQHSHKRSGSRQIPMQTESKSVGEYALHHLFNSFIVFADPLINRCAVDMRDQDLRLEAICGPGVDQTFDQLVAALGHVSRLKPKPLIDSLMLWRKGKSEAAAEARFQLHQYSQMKSTPGFSTEMIANLQRDLTFAERRSSVAVYLLCRVMMHIFEQSDISAITPDTADRLEDVIFSQLKVADLEWLAESPLHHSNWVMYGQLLGAMSGMDFKNVTKQFLGELERMQLHVPRRDAESRIVDGRAVLVIRGMRWLRIKPEDPASWDDFCTFMQTTAGMAANASGQSVKYEFNVLFGELLLPLAARLTSQFNAPRWRVTVESLKTRLIHMHSKPKHWANTFPTMSVVTCASPDDVFASSWLNLIAPLQSKLKDRPTRPTALRAICRLVWTYLYRISEPQSSTVKNLSDIIRMVFGPGRKGQISTDSATADPLIQLIRIIGYKFPELCFRQIIFPLVNSDLFTSDREIKIADLEPEKIAVGIRGFLAVIADLEKGEQPPFPVNFEVDQGSEPYQMMTNAVNLGATTGATSKNSLLKQERLSRPILVSGLSEVMIQAYMRFCEVLARITIFCDNHFGGQITLDEKFNHTPKTPMGDTFGFTRRDDQPLGDPRQGFYDLLHVAIQALPRCLPQQIPLKSVVNLLCIGTAHVQSNIARSSAQSLKSIARQGHAQTVTVGFARFISNYDERYATMSDGGMLGPAHIENTLNLYIELLRIWVEEVISRSRRLPDTTSPQTESSRSVPLDQSALLALVDEIESHGLFFLCSPAHKVRAIAIEVLRLVTDFDRAMTTDASRVISILEGSSQTVLDVNDERLTVAERSRIQRGLRKSNTTSTLIELCGSDAPYDATLWFKIFPNLVKIAFQTCPFTTALTREMICKRLSQMQKIIGGLADDPRSLTSGNMNALALQDLSGIGNASPQVVISQWKLYLVFACTTLTVVSPQYKTLNSGEAHSRKSSKSSQHAPEKILSAAELFARIIPFLAVNNVAVREAVVAGVGSINANLYRTLLESLQPAVVNCNDEARVRAVNHIRTASSPRQMSRRNVHLRTEVAHVYKLTSSFLKSEVVLNDEWILNNLVNYTKDLRIFLNDAEVQMQWEFTKLRTHYCGLTEALFDGIANATEPMRWMSFQSRKAAFALMEEWCGFTPSQASLREHGDVSRMSLLDRGPDRTQGISNAALERDKRDLRTAALSAMAALCGGPISIVNENNARVSFDVLRMLQWIDTIFDTPSDKNHAIGRKALKNLIIHNKEYNYFLARSIDICYTARSPKALESYFDVVNEVLTETEDFNQPFWRIICIALYTLGNENYLLRMKSAKLLRLVESREAQTSAKLQELDISVSDRTIAVYKRAQFEMSQKLAQHYPQLAFHVFSEFARFFKDLQPDTQRQMVAAMLPWVQTIELQLDPNGGPTPPSYMFLVNLFEITVRCSSHLHNEIQALWQALANSPGAGNVQLILDFIVTLCLEKREQNFVNYAKQIIVHLAETAEGTKVIDFLLLHVTPKLMIQERERLNSLVAPPEATTYPYLADLGLMLPSGAKQQGFSFGQLCLILLVDLVVAPLQLQFDNIITLLQICLALWDSPIPVVQDHAREMLVHLIHESVRSKLDEDEASPTRRTIEELIDAVRQEDPRVTWHYEEYNGKKDDENDLRAPDGMLNIATEIVTIFTAVYPGVQDEWGRVALTWASNCPVQHLACRSFQIFRCLSSGIDQSMLAGMLARLSNTVADEALEVQTFSKEILTTLRTIVETLSPVQIHQYPQLFWTTCACLDTVHEAEFTESLFMLERFIEKFDFRDPAVIAWLIEAKPPHWQATFEGIQALIYKGLRSSTCLERTLKLLTSLSTLPSNALLGDDHRLVFAIFGHFPQFLRWFETERGEGAAVRGTAEALARAAGSSGLSDVSKCLHSFAEAKYHTDGAFMSEILPAIRAAFFPTYEFQCLVFLMGLLMNQRPWYRLKTLQLLSVIVPHIDMRKPDISSKGPDVIAPLLRLLQTEHCQQALLVLDNVMVVSATPLDNKHLRMSMAGAGASRAFRKEYDRVQSLYGIPEDSGWAIPVPAEHAATTRSNVHAVFRTCPLSEGATPLEDATPNIELVNEDFPASYFPRTATMLSDETRTDVAMHGPNDLVTKLESLDDFFDDDDTSDTISLNTAMMSPPLLTSTSRVPGGPLTSGLQGPPTRESLYDQQTYPILHQSLHRNASVSSFQNGFADNMSSSHGPRISPTRAADPQASSVMNPTAFAPIASIRQALTSSSTSRPQLHARSITSPTAGGGTNTLAASPPYPNHLITNTDSISTSTLYEEDPTAIMSDDELASGGSKPSSNHTKTASAPGFRSGFRSGIRRLTGGHGDSERFPRGANDQRKRDLVGSPEVPKVPQVYLQGGGPGVGRGEL